MRAGINALRFGVGLLSISMLSPAIAEWPADTSANLVVADSGADEVQAKIRATSDGRCYVSWLGAGGYDTHLQLLDSHGNEQFAHGGIVAIDGGSFSSTQDYGLAVDSESNAIVVNRDNSTGPVHCRVAKYYPDGSQAWSVIVSTVTDINAPHVTVVDDNYIVAGWSSGSSVYLQRLDPDGNPQWAAGGIVQAPASGSYTLNDLQPGDGGSVIASFLKGTQRNLHAQKYDIGGSPQWNGGTPIVVFDGSALQFGYFPSFQADTEGGAVFAYYETGGTRNAYVQHISSGGGELFAHNGTPVSTNTTGRSRLTPTAAYNAQSGETFVFWTETNSAQNQWGLYGQKLDAGGARQWGDSAIEYLPLSAVQNANLRTVLFDDGAAVFYNVQPGNTTMDGIRVDGAGAVVWNNTPASAASSKSRLDVAVVTCGDAVLAWQDGAFGSQDIHVQNVRPDGTFGPRPLLHGDLNCDGVVNNFDIDPFVAAIVNATAYEAAYPCCDIRNGDIDNDNATNNFDIDPFVQCIIAPPAPGDPCP